MEIENYLKQLHIIIGNGDFEAGLEYIGDNINKNLPFNNSYLHNAIFYKMDMVAMFLIDNGANVNKLNENKNTPLHYACIFKISPIVLNILIKKCNYTKNICDEYPLDIICKNGDVELFKVFTLYDNIISTFYDLIIYYSYGNKKLMRLILSLEKSYSGSPKTMALIDQFKINEVNLMIKEFEKINIIIPNNICKINAYDLLIEEFQKNTLF